MDELNRTGSSTETTANVSMTGDWSGRATKSCGKCNAPSGTVAAAETAAVPSQCGQSCCLGTSRVGFFSQQVWAAGLAGVIALAKTDWQLQSNWAIAIARTSTAEMAFDRAGTTE